MHPRAQSRVSVENRKIVVFGLHWCDNRLSTFVGGELNIIVSIPLGVNAAETLYTLKSEHFILAICWPSKHLQNNRLSTSAWWIGRKRMDLWHHVRLWLKGRLRVEWKDQDHLVQLSPHFSAKQDLFGEIEFKSSVLTQPRRTFCLPNPQGKFWNFVQLGINAWFDGVHLEFGDQSLLSRARVHLPTKPNS